jgi:hypothetical protein
MVGREFIISLLCVYMCYYSKQRACFVSWAFPWHISQLFWISGNLSGEMISAGDTTNLLTNLQPNWIILQSWGSERKENIWV